MAIGNTGNTPSTGPLKPLPAVAVSAKLTASVTVEQQATVDAPRPKTDDVSTTRPTWEKVGMPQPKDDDWPSYETLFGKTPYVKDPANAKMKEVVAAAVAADPELAKTAAGKGVDAGKLDAEAIKALQKHLKAKGYDVGSAGADGKLGPKTYAALVKFLDNEGAPAAPKGGAAPKPPLKVDGHGTGVLIDDDRKPAAKKAVEIPRPPLKVDGHGTGVELPDDDDPKPAPTKRWPSYQESFGKAPYVTDPKNEKIRDLAKAAVEKDSSLGKPPVGPALAAGKLDAEAVKALQTEMKAKGYDLGPAGVDGKLGPKTYAAIVKFLEGGGQAPDGPKPGPKPAPTPVPAPPAPPEEEKKHGLGVDLEVDVDLKLAGQVDLPLSEAQIAKACKLPLLRVQNAWPHLAAAMAEAGIKDRNAMIAMIAFTTRESSMHAKLEFGPGTKYEGRADLGNTQPGDGKLFNGRGYIQLRGRANYEHMSKLVGMDLVSNPDLAMRPDVAAKIAVAKLKESGGLEAARRGDWAAFNQRMGGGSMVLLDQHVTAIQKAIG